MGVAVHATFLPYDDLDASLAFYCCLLGFEVRKDFSLDGRRLITVGVSGQPRVSIVLESSASAGDTRIILATSDLEDIFERLEAAGAEVAQEPIRQPDGTRDCAFLDPAGNLIHIAELPGGRSPAPSTTSRCAGSSRSSVSSCVPAKCR